MRSVYDLIKDYTSNLFLNQSRYRTHSEAVIISCYFNPQNNPYRLLAFQKFYRSIKHLNHRIYECVIGDSKPQLPKTKFIRQIKADNLLWHKEAILNKIIKELPEQFRYVFWVDADVIFTNLNWLTDSVKELQTNNIVQPFEYCIHLEKNQLKPSFNVDEYKKKIEYNLKDTKARHPMMWRSFCSNVKRGIAGHTNYDIHGHVGFAWGARRECLDTMREFHNEAPLYDRALIGGADHIIAHAALGDCQHNCIKNAFKDSYEEIYKWSFKFYTVMRGLVGYAKGDLYHIWHGDVQKREYLKRIQDFDKEINEIKQKDKNGLYVGKDKYVKKYYSRREVFEGDEFDVFDFSEFFEDMGYNFTDMMLTFSNNSDPEYAPEPEYTPEPDNSGEPQTFVGLAQEPTVEPPTSTVELPFTPDLNIAPQLEPNDISDNFS